MKWTLVIATVFMASSASAQSTRCYAVGSTVQCDTYQTELPQPPSPNVQQGYGNILNTLQQSGQIYDHAQEQAARRKLIEQQMEINRLKAEKLRREAERDGN